MNEQIIEQAILRWRLAAGIRWAHEYSKSEKAIDYLKMQSKISDIKTTLKKLSYI